MKLKDRLLMIHETLDSNGAVLDEIKNELHKTSNQNYTLGKALDDLDSCLTKLEEVIDTL